MTSLIQFSLRGCSRKVENAGIGCFSALGEQRERGCGLMHWKDIEAHVKL